MTVGRVSRMCSNHLRMRAGCATISWPQQQVGGAAYLVRLVEHCKLSLIFVSRGVLEIIDVLTDNLSATQSAQAHPAMVSTCLFVMRYPCPSIIYEIIMIWSVCWSGNLRGCLVVSISYAMTTGSARLTMEGMRSSLIAPAWEVTSYQSPTRMSASVSAIVKGPKRFASSIPRGNV